MLLLIVFSFTLSLCKSLKYSSKNYLITPVKVQPAKSKLLQNQNLSIEQIFTSCPKLFWRGECMSWNLIQLLFVALMKTQ